ncbi:hypothetical protein BGZ83_003602 [Gryganskiella cystojenkinii]|nr:hypothetical protein BGZ83_003602 [Gryganskiella cystojenkinii]
MDWGSISKVNIYFFTPCLVFTKIASALSWDRFLAFWPIPFFYVLFCVISLVVARVGAKILRYSSADTRFVTAGILFFNNQSLPLALIQSLALSAAGSRLLRDENDTKEGVLASVCDSLVRWSFGLNMLSHQTQDDSQSEIKSSRTSYSNSSALTQQHHLFSSPGAILVDIPSDIGSNSGSDNDEQDHVQQTRSYNGASISHRIKDWFVQLPSRLGSFMTPPLVTAVMALVVALIPPLHKLLMSPQSKVYTFLIRPLETCSAAAVPLILVCLGAQVMEFDKAPSAQPSDQETAAVTAPLTSVSTSTSTAIDSNESSPSPASTLRQQRQERSEGREVEANDEADERRPLLDQTQLSTSQPEGSGGFLTPIQFTIVGRLVIVPLSALSLILFCPWDLSPLLTADPAFRLTLVLLISAPTAINLIQICQITGFREQQMASLLFWSYVVFAVPCVLAWSVVALWASSWKY